FSKKLEEELDKTIKQYNDIAQKINVGALNVEMMADDIAAAERTAKRVADELEAMETERKAPPRVTPMEDGVRIVPPEDQRTKQFLGAALAAVVALGAIFFAVSWWEWRAKRIDGVDEVMHGLGMTVFGTLPAWRNDKSRKLIGNKPYRDVHGQSLFTESVDAT